MPQTAVAHEVVENAVQLACRAPSYHNSQPWQWVVGTLIGRSFPQALIRCRADPLAPEKGCATGDHRRRIGDLSP